MIINVVKKSSELNFSNRKIGNFFGKIPRNCPPPAKLLDNLFSLCYNVVYELCDFWIKTKFLEVANRLCGISL